MEENLKEVSYEKEKEEKGFLKSLFDAQKTVPNVVESDDIEVKGGGIGDRWSDKKEFIPPVIKSIPESLFLWKWVRSPLNTKEDIQKRQELIDYFKEEDRETLINLKNTAYGISIGVRKLFAEVSVSDYESYPLLVAYLRGHSEFKQLVLEALQSIQQGKYALGQLEDYFRESPDVLVQELAGNIQNLRKETEYLTNDYFLKQQFSEGKSQNSAQKVYNDVERMGALLEFAHITEKENYARAEYNENEPAQYKKGWMFSRSKESQVQNNSPEDTPLIVYSGANMSGKSQTGLKQNYWMQLLAQSMGYVPSEVEEGGKSPNFHLYDSFFYLDRATTDHNHNLSAYGKEVQNWKQTFEKLGKKPFLAVDEGFSTTSPEDQYKMLYATALAYKDEGVKMHLATHNENFIQALSDHDDATIYNLKIHFSPEGTLICDHVLQKGAGDSQAIDVAKSLEYPEAPLQKAKEFLEGAANRSPERINVSYEKVEEYTEEEREKLKNEKNSLYEFFPKKSSIEASKDDPWRDYSYDNKDKLIRPFTTDRDFHTDRWVWSPEGYHNIMILQGGKLSSPEILERQNLFEQLSSSEHLERATEVCENIEKIFYRYCLLGRFISSYGEKDWHWGLNPFPDGMHPHKDFNKKEILVFKAFMNLNKKVLKDEFPFEKQWGMIEKLEIEKQEIDEELKKINIEYFQETTKKRHEQEITHPQIKELFLQIVNENSKEQEDFGTINAFKIRKYFIWLEKELGFSKYWDLERLSVYRKLYELLKKEDLEVNYFDLNIDTKEDRGSLEEILSFLDLETDMVLNAETIEMCWEKLEKIKNFEKKDRIVGLLEREQEKYDHFFNKQLISPERIQKIKNIMIDFGYESEGNEQSIETFKGFIKTEKEKIISFLNYNREVFPSKRLKDMNREDIRGELETIFAYMNEKDPQHITRKLGREDSVRSMKEGEVLSELLAMWLDTRNYFQEVMELADEYDSVHLQQFKNQWKEQLEHINGYAMDDSSFEFYNSFGIPQNKKGSKSRGFKHHNDVFDIFENTFDSTLAPLWNDYETIKKEYLQIVKLLLPYKRTGPAGSKLEYIKCILRGQDNDIRHEGIKRVLQNMDWLKEGISSEFYEQRENSFKEKGIKRNSISNEEFWPKDIFQSWYEKNIVKTGMKAEFENIMEQLEQWGTNVESFVGDYNIDMKYNNWSAEETMDYIKKGDIHYLKQILQNRFTRKAVRNLDIRNLFLISRDRVDTKTMNNMLENFHLLFLFAKKIKEEGMAKVDFNEDGKIDFQDLYYFQKDPEEQVKNNFTFDPKETRSVLFSGPNMSGKTFLKKSLIGGVQSAMMTGYAPAKEATMPFFDATIYLDRVCDKLDENLSAFGNEVEYWKKVFQVLAEKEKVFVCVDESFSTTSPLYQAAMTYAVNEEISKNKGHYLVLSTHNHDFLEHEEQRENTDIYHFDYDIDDKGEIDFKHKLTPGHKQSEAIPVARILRYPEKILKIAEGLEKNE